MIRCGRCGKGLQVDVNRSGNPLYRERHATECETNRHSCTAAKIDGQIRDVFSSLVLPSDWRQKIARHSTETEGPSISDLEERRHRLGYSYRRMAISEAEFERELEELDTQLRLAQLSTPIELDEVAELLENLPDLWREATPEERHRLLGTLVEAVYVDISSQHVVGIAPTPAAKMLIEAAIKRIAGAPAILVDPDELGESERMELVETGEN